MTEIMPPKPISPPQRQQPPRLRLSSNGVSGKVTGSGQAAGLFERLYRNPDIAGTSSTDMEPIIGAQAVHPDQIISSTSKFQSMKPLWLRAAPVSGW
jgi:hypothetical protein